MCPKVVLVPNRNVYMLLFLFFTIPRKENLFLMINVLHKFLFDTLYITEAFINYKNLTTTYSVVSIKKRSLHSKLPNKCIIKDMI